MVRYRVMAWLSLAAVLAYFCRNSVGVAESTIRDQLELSKAEMGWFLGAFFWSYALCQVPAAYVGERFGTRRVLGWSAFLWSLGILLVGSATNLAMLIIAQLLMGVAQAAVFPCAVKSIAAWIPEPNRATACSFLSIGMQLGAIATALLTGRLITVFDWRIVFISYALPGVLWSIGFVASFRNHPADDPAVNSAERELISPASSSPPPPSGPDEESGTVPWLAILTNRSVLCLCGQQSFRAAGYAFFALWFPTFLQETRGLDVEASGYLQGTLFFSTLLGGLVGGLLIDRIYKRTGNRKLSRSGVGAVCMLSCGWLIFCAYFADNVFLAVALIDLGAFTAAVAGPCAYVATIDLGKKHVPAVFGLMNMSGNLAAAAAPAVIGYLSQNNWNMILILYAVAYLLAAICWWLVDPDESVESRDVRGEDFA